MTLIQDSAKPHDVIDDIESVLWVLIAIAIRRFEYEGHFPMQMFDEQSHPPQGRSGGVLKSFWVWNQCVTGFGHFECRPLDQFFTEIRAFHDVRLQKFRDSRKKDASSDTLEILEQCRNEIIKDLSKVLTIFDRVLNDQTADWTGGIPISSSNKKTAQTPEPEQIPAQPAQTRNRKRKRDEPNDGDNPRQAKQVNVQGTKDVQPPEPSRRKRAAPPLPRKVYNLRPRKR